MKIGYARVSTSDQNLESQIDLLKKEGCEKIYSEKESGGRKNRPELLLCLENLREGDTLVVTKLDRLGRTVKQLVELIESFQEKNIHFKCLSDPIDTTSAAGEFFFHIMSVFSQLEQELIRERTNVGLTAARERGQVGGRPETHARDKKEIAYQMVMEKPYQSVLEIVSALNMSRSTIYRYIEKKRQILV